MSSKKTPGQIGLDVVLWSAIGVLVLVVLYPVALEYEWLSVAPLISGIGVATLIGIWRAL